MNRKNIIQKAIPGKTAIVKSYLEAFPQYLSARVQQAFTFLQLAQCGGDDAKELPAYFQNKGMKETNVTE